MRGDLTSKQAELLSYIKTYTAYNGYPPSLKEMAAHMGVRSLSTIHQHVATLQRKGQLTKNSDRKRNIIHAHDVPKLLRIPLIGDIAAGLPIEELEYPEPIYVSTNLIKTSVGYFALKVRGDSMVDDGIQNGDTVIIKSQNYVEHIGQTIVAIVNGGATLKKFGGITKDGFIKLIPRNPDVKIILADPENFEVRGRLVGLLRTVN